MNQKKVKLELSNGEIVIVNKIYLATGFGKSLPGGKLIDDLIQNANLRVSMDDNGVGCGFPIVNANLGWHDRIYVTGALAELEIGPSARNIAGARLAAERIVSAI